MLKPIEGNYEHWALCLNDDDGDVPTVFEVTGEHPNFEKSTLKYNPKDTGRHRRDIVVGVINKRDIPEFLQTVEHSKANNTTVDWNCQDYVIELVEKLYDECIIDEDDKYYKKGLQEAKDKYFGPL
jgi:hypothetical protein